MIAAVIDNPGGPDAFTLRDIDEPEFGPDEVLIQVKATALNRADLMQRRGRYPAPDGIDQRIPGLEMAGVVEQIGARVTSFSQGDRVFALLGGGGYAEKVVVHERMLMNIPQNLSFEDAAGVPEGFFTAYDALFNQAKLKMGESLLIHAAGSGVGTAAIQLAHQMSVSVFGTAGSKEKLFEAEKLGLDIGINYKEEDFSKKIEESTKGSGVNVILDVIGAPYWEQNLNSLSQKGRMVLVGAMGGRLLETNLGLLGPKRLRIHGTVLRSRPIEEKITLTQQIVSSVLPLLESGKIHSVTDSVFPLSNVAEAHQRMEDNLNFGKIILSI
ncbi:MAG: NAD(P)H-quinone oxidoreductase [Chloroflexi bacterium]|nr:NAD(P)H-quinone oxidoreductase [Chloroflexota bacterium]